jgi:Xaa-Pro aminopeptidase
VTINNPPRWLDIGAAFDLRDRLITPEAVVEYRERQERIRARMRKLGLDALITFKPAAVDYMSGYSTTAPGKVGLALTPGGARLHAAASEVGRALLAPGASAIDTYGWDGPMDLQGWIRELANQDVRSIGLELGEPTTPPAMVDALKHHGIQSLDITGLVDSVRLFVSETELTRIREAADVTAMGLEAAVTEARRDDARDSTVAAALMSSMMRASDSIARSNVTIGIDEQGGIPHSPWNGRPFVNGSVMFLEFSGASRRYCAPVMRTLVKGQPSVHVLRLYDMVHEMLDIVMSRLRAGMACSTIAYAAAEVLDGASDILFHNNFGYPVGLSDHGTWMNGAAFHITTANEHVLKENMVFHLPIVLRHFGEVAVGESHTVRITQSGVDVLTGNVQPTGLIPV